MDPNNIMTEEEDVPSDSSTNGLRQVPSAPNRRKTASEQVSSESEQISEDEPRVPGVWAQREAHALEFMASTSSRHDSGYRQFQSKTVHPQRNGNAGFKGSTAGHHVHANPRPSLGAIFPRNISGYNTMPAGHFCRLDGRNRVPVMLLRHPQADQIFTPPYAGRHLSAPTLAAEETDSEVGSQFSPTRGMISSQPAEPKPSSSSSGTLPRRTGPVLLPVSFSLLIPNHAFLQPDVLTTVSSGSSNIESSESSKMTYDPCSSTNCCKGGLLVMWLIISLIILGAVVGIAAGFARRNSTS